VHVGLNLIYLVPGETGGMETYARELIPAIAHERPDLEITSFVNRETHERNSGGPWSTVGRTVLVPVHARHRTEWVRGEQQLLPRIAARAGVDLVHSLASTAPAWGRFRRVVTIHDLIYRIYPEAHAGLRSRAMGVLVPFAARRSDRILAPSESTRNDLMRLLNVPAKKIDVTPYGVGTSFARPTDAAELRARHQLGERAVVFTASAKRPHKNLMRLLDALALIPSERRPVLVLPGYATQHESELRKHASHLRLDADTRFLGWISAADLEAFYRLSSCFVFPSLYEGFGLPVLEAMARGLPVAASDRSSLAEVAGGAARMFDPESSQAMAEAIEDLLHDRTLVNRLRTAGYERVGRFTWSATARATLQAYESAAALSR
jgi:glycosyltransferase involved in cell wall biosynthesis